MALWWEPGDDTAGLVSRCKRLVNSFRELLGDKDLYLLSSKLIAKKPEKGGAFAWHQVEPWIIYWFCIFKYRKCISGLWIFLREWSLVSGLRFCQYPATQMLQVNLSMLTVSSSNSFDTGVQRQRMSPNHSWVPSSWPSESWKVRGLSLHWRGKDGGHHD